MSRPGWLRRRWVPVDWIVAAYTAWSGLLILWFSDAVPEWRRLVAVHASVLVSMVIIPPRGATWEARALGPWGLRAIRECARFVRWAYPLPLSLFFFEEGAYTVNMIFRETPYWFEPKLYAADAAVLGELPARLFAPWVNPLTTELMHFFYWSYYIILIGGVVLGWVGYRGQQRVHRTPAPGFELVITSLVAAFLLSFVFYPWLAARGPWESPELMAELPALEGFIFTWMIDRILAHGAVSGNCFPSAHISGAWAIVFALALVAGHRRVAFWFGFFAAGMTLGSVFTRYHHAMDVPAGFACGVAGTLIAIAVTGPREGTPLRNAPLP